MSADSEARSTVDGRFESWFSKLQSDPDEAQAWLSHEAFKEGILCRRIDVCFPDQRPFELAGGLPRLKVSLTALAAGVVSVVALPLFLERESPDTLIPAWLLIFVAGVASYWVRIRPFAAVAVGAGLLAVALLSGVAVNFRAHFPLVCLAVFWGWSVPRILEEMSRRAAIKTLLARPDHFNRALVQKKIRVVSAR